MKPEMKEIYIAYLSVKYVFAPYYNIYNAIVKKYKVVERMIQY